MPEMYRRGPRAPFRPPRCISSSRSNSSSQDEESKQGPLKDRKEYEQGELENESCDNGMSKRRKTKGTLSTTGIVLDIEEEKSDGSQNHCGPSRLGNKNEVAVLWRRCSNKKNKTWEGDGILELTKSELIFKGDISGDGKYKEMGKSKKKPLEGVLTIGGYEVEVDDYGSDKENDSGRQKALVSGPVIPGDQDRFKKVIPRASGLANGQKENKRSPLYNPQKENLLLMPRPPNMDLNNIIDVVVDPLLSRQLRPHQCEAVKFLYECVMGFRNFKGNGALLADEMGLGKTFVTITLIWTLLKQNPYAKEKGPVCKKVLIACPVTLIGNWKKEFSKWLGFNRLGVLAINYQQNAATEKKEILSFGKTHVYQVLIMSYEKIMSSINEVSNTTFDLLVCDEGHRLKSSSNKVLKCLNDLHISKKVLLTGTPIQNDLNEFYNLLQFINPNCLGSYRSFQHNFIRHIERARDVNCINKETLKLGEMKSNELIDLTKEYTLRRTNKILTEFLPRRTDIVLFCPPTDVQICLFYHILESIEFSSILESGNNNKSFALITLFKKICNSPLLVAKDESLEKIIKGNFDLNFFTKKTASGKINLLVPLLLETYANGEKLVLVSNYTQTLDMLQDVILKLKLSFLRLDGSTSSKERSAIVKNFNNLPLENCAIFLLSAKSGGLGLNLVGASRLILFDNDWNPSTDLQAMARIHRDGQQKPVFIYRFITTGSIEEKIFQRQLMKSNLTNKFLDNDLTSLNLFDISDLKDLFTVNETTICNTHDLIQCDCAGLGQSNKVEEKKSDDESDSDIDTLKGWISALDFKQRDNRPFKQKLSIRNALLDYKHFIPNRMGTEMAFYDDVLHQVMSKFKAASDPIPFSFMLTKITENSTM